MKVRRSLVAVAVGTILATAGVGYSAPIHRYYEENYRQARIAEAQEERGEWYARRGEQLERMGYWRRGEVMERRGHQLSREGERHERFGAWEERHER